MLKDKIETVKISDLIKVLNIAKDQLGDIPVIHSTDEEGNSYNTIDIKSISYMDTKIGKTLVIYPYDENIDEELF